MDLSVFVVNVAMKVFTAEALRSTEFHGDSEIRHCGTSPIRLRHHSVSVVGGMGYHLNTRLNSKSKAFPARFGVLDAQIMVAEGLMIEEQDSEELASDERRHYDRSRLIVDVHFDGGDATGVASTKDISMGGLYMSTKADIAIGDTLTLRIPLAGQHVVVKADVVYSNPDHGIGVRFHRLTPEARELMERELPKP